MNAPTAWRAARSRLPARRRPLAARMALRSWSRRTRARSAKDADEILREHGAEALRALIEAATPAELSEDGWIKKLGSLSDLDYELQRKELAEELGGIRLSTLDAMRKQGQAAAGTDESTRARDADRDRARARALRRPGRRRVRDRAARRRPHHRRPGALDALPALAHAHLWPRNPITLRDGRQVPSGVPAGALDEALGQHRRRRCRYAAARPDAAGRLVALIGPRSTGISPAPRTARSSRSMRRAGGWSTGRRCRWSTPRPPSRCRSRSSTHDVEQVLAELEYLLGLQARPTDEFVLLLGFMVHLPDAGRPLHPAVHHGRAGQRQKHPGARDQDVIDPTRVPLRFRPASRDDLAISAMRQWLPVYDNVSSPPAGHVRRAVRDPGRRRAGQAAPLLATMRRPWSRLSARC